MSKSSILMFIITTMQLLCLNGELFKKRENEKEHLCLTTSILCVKDMILKISKTAGNIRVTASAIEDSIRKKERNELSLQQNINRIRKRIMAYTGFPASKSHDDFDDMNNIARSDLVRLMIEGHDAVSYLYYSIKNLLRESFFDHEYDESFNTILQNLRHNILCNYRNILHVYFENWQPISPINSIRLLQTQTRDITSFDYRTYAVIILESLRQWMERTEHVLNNLENKLL